jgi:glycosyltransferase involved in cell wall biosynthesis
MKKLKIWLIQHGEPLPVYSRDTVLRTARLSKELASRGHDVTYWCSSLWHHKKTVYCRENREVKVDNYNLHILHAGSYKSNHSLARYFHHRKMARLFTEEAGNREKPDIIIAGLPIHYCAYEAVKFGEKKQVPVIVDIRDAWPDIFLMLFPKKIQWIGRLIFRKDFEIARVAMRNATVLVSMMSHLLEWGAREYAERDCNKDDRVFYIGGDDVTAACSEDVFQLFPELKGRTEGRFIVNYIGGFSYLNHPMVIIEAAKYLSSIGHKDDFLFLLAGNGDYYNRCVKAAKDLDNVMFLGWLDADGIAAVNSITSTGVIPSVEEFSFPNKAFSYIGSGLPILSSEHGDLHDLLEKYKAGFYFDISEPMQLANKILDLSRLDNESYKKISENCKCLFKEHLQADVIYRQYADHVEYIADKYGCMKLNDMQ